MNRLVLWFVGAAFLWFTGGMVGALIQGDPIAPYAGYSALALSAANTLVLADRRTTGGRRDQSR